MAPRLLLALRLVAASLRRRPVEAVVTVVAIAAATATLTLGLALHGVTNHPYQTTRSVTSGPDVVAMPTSHGPASGPGSFSPPVGSTSTASRLAAVEGLVHAPGVVAHSGPYPVSFPTMQAKGSKVLAVVEGRTTRRAAVDQPYVTQGTWVRPGGVVVERSFAEELNLAVGDRVTLNGRTFPVVGIAVTAAVPPYPYTVTGVAFDTLPDIWSQAVGLVWTTEPIAESLATPSVPLSYMLNLKLANPSQASAFVHAHADDHGLYMDSWQNVRQVESQQTMPFQRGLLVGSALLDLLAVASLAVIVGGRLAERTRRVGLLKAIGATPRLVAGVLLLEYLTLALLGATVGLVVGWLAAPLIANPGAGLVGNVGSPPVTLADVGWIVALGVAVAGLAAWIPAVRAARTSTTAALADSARVPTRRPFLIATASHLPVPLLLGLRLAARRPRRMILTLVSVTITMTTIVAVLAIHAHEAQAAPVPRSLFAIPVNPNTRYTDAVLLVLTVVLVFLSIVNAIVITWATSVDSRQPLGVARALGATTRQVSAGLSTALLIPSLPGVIAGIPLGLLLVKAADHGSSLTVPSTLWLLVAFLGVLLTLGALSSIPARFEARRSPLDSLQAEST
jgi:putative ABC transport system permease protein